MTRGEARHYLRAVVISLAAALFLSLSGIFGTGHTLLAVRLAYWGVVMTACTLVAMAIIRAVQRREFLGNHPVAQWAISTLLMTPPLTVVVWLVSGLMFNHTFEAADLLRSVPQVLLISAAMTAINALADRRPMETHAAPPGSAPVKFLERLPFKLREATIVAVQAEDHYLRVHTDAGEALILMRLSDAVGELAGLEGARTHRSWWVARDAVTGARRSDGRAVLELKGGLEAPVSRSFARALRDEGWF